MVIRNFLDIDIEQASKLAKLTWGDFYTEESDELQRFIYDFMVQYYDLNREYSFSIVEDDLKGFLLGVTKKDSYKSLNFKEKVKALKSEQERKIAFDLFNYLEMCGNEVKNIINDDDIILGLFVSIKKGCGKLVKKKI